MQEACKQHTVVMLLKQVAYMAASAINGWCEIVQPYQNLAHVVNNATLVEYQVGGASDLAELRLLKKELDQDNLFTRHGLVGL